MKIRRTIKNLLDRGLRFAFPFQSTSDQAPCKGTQRMTAQRHFKRMVVDILDDVYLLHMGEMEIWDGADLALLREALTQFIEREGCRSIAVDMQFVKYIPSGFFGMLFDWHERRGVVFSLTPPQPNVQRMLWFQQFFRSTDDGWFELDPQGKDLLLPFTLLPEPVLIEDDY